MAPLRLSQIAIVVVLAGVEMAVAGCAGKNSGDGTGGSGASAGTSGQAPGAGGAGNGPGTAGTAGGTAGAHGGAFGQAAGAGGHAGTAGGTGGTTGAAGSTGAAGTTGTAGASGVAGRAGGTSGQTGGASGQAGAGGAGGQAGGAGGTTVAAGTCLDNVMNGTETGVDCGGSCPACPTYKINPPNLKNAAKSGCQSGGTGFMCTRSMAFSPEFKQAAMDDWGTGNPPFVYGVVGHDKDSGGLDTQSSNTCCQCYQLVFESPRDAVSGLPVPKPMIVQAFNTAAGGAKNFDIFMAKGGEGSNTAGCSAQYTNYPTTGEPNNGGIRPVNFSAQCATSMNMYTEATVSSTTCQQQIASQCDMITSSSASVQSSSQQSCVEANQPANLYHLNWNVRAERVECPTNLTRVTGCKLKSQNLPQPDPTAQTAATAGSGFVTGYSTTTMQDCCRPTCAYQSTNNVDPNTADASYAIFYTCDVAGNAQ